MLEALGEGLQETQGIHMYTKTGGETCGISQACTYNCKHARRMYTDTLEEAVHTYMLHD